VLRLPKNLGPAGGYAAGLRAFLESRGSWAWVLDDDCFARPGALDAQLDAAEAAIGARRPLVLAHAVDADTAEVMPGMGWWGALVPREAVEQVGVPNEALVWWTEDTEYLQWRIPGAGFPVLACNDAVVEVSRTRVPGEKPPWKFYYEARNQVYHRLWVQRPDPSLPRPRPTPRHLKVRIRVRRSWQAVWRLGARALFTERTGRVHKVRMVAWGTLDGVRGRLGETVPLGAADRPEIGQSDAG
jgi:GT2 family glycosyltransferase